VTVWNALDIRRRIIVGLATVAVVAAILGLARIAATPNMALLYANLESGQAGEVVSALEQRGVAYEVRGNSIFVDSSKRDELRMTLASEGLPSNTTHGYELLDNLSGFGTTAQMFDAAYWRAKEGELARTIVSQRSISSARVHIATGGTNPFRRDIKPSASVTVTASGGNAITGKQARALKYLVASAVTGLSPEDVSVIDSQGNLVAGPEDGAAKVVDDRTETLRKRVQHLLEARVGPGNAVVEVSVDTVTRSETLRERKIDPESRVAISSDKQERTNSASDQASGVTVASNVPNGKAGDGQTTSSRKSETRERVNYEVSETEHKVTVPPGAIRRLTVAVLINGTTGAEPGGKQAPVSRNQKELDALRELVASAVGYDEARGDVITIRAMPFEQLEPAGTAAKQSFLSALNLDLMSIIQTLVLGAVALILGFSSSGRFSGSHMTSVCRLRRRTRSLNRQNNPTP